jgi:predicted Ser/Thr protein kinase
MHREMTYRDALRGVERYLVRGRFAKADVFISRFRGERFIVKDFGSKGLLERTVIGRTVISRECRAYGSLAGLDGLPTRFVRLAPSCLAIEYLEGQDLGGIGRGEIGPGVILQLERIINDLHERGWVHLDLQRRTNILLVDGKVFVIDLASAVRPGRFPLAGSLLLRLLGFADRLSLIKMKAIFAPELLSPADRRIIRLRNLLMPTKWRHE